MQNAKRVSKKVKVRFPLGGKLAIIIGLIVLISLGTVTILNSYFVGQDVQITAENNNLSTNTRGASIVEDKLSTIRSNTFQFLDLVNSLGSSQNAIKQQARAFFFERNPDIACIYILSKNQDKSAIYENNRFFISNEIEPDAVTAMLDAFSKEIEFSCSGQTIAQNASPFLGIPSMTLLFPWRESGRDETCVITFSIESISDILGTDSINTTFMLNDTDDLLFHPDTDSIIRGENLKNHPLVLDMRQNNQNNADSRQVPFSLDEKKYFGAYQKLNLADIVIYTTVPLDVVLEAVMTTRMNNIYLTAVVFFLSIIIILIYSRFAISRNLRKLTSAAEEIKEGNFDTKVVEELNTHRHDEIGVLNQSTKDELSFLTLFSKFTNQGVAKAIARNDIDFEPHLKDIAIFFSDIRGFTQISDGFKNRFGDDSPREIIGFLNDYMARMVNCITLSGGNVDKFEGDAIMAVWGLLREDSSAISPEEYEEHKIEDAINALRGTIAMRYALMEYNKAAEAFTKAHEKEAKAQYKPHIRIGCGINFGRATCGIMGSNDKMEYTAIGDAVNFASRTESSNKPCGTDILITEDVLNLLKKRFIRCTENRGVLAEKDKENELIVERIPVSFEVKGKGTQHFYGVVNMPRFDIEKFFKAGDEKFTLDADCSRAVGKNGPRNLNEVRSLLGIPTPDFARVKLGEEENKIVVKTDVVLG